MSTTDATGDGHRRRRRWLRITFLVLVLGALGYIGVRTYLFLEDAQMSLGLTRLPGQGIDALLINQQKWEPPADSALRPAQIHFALRIATTLDSLDRSKVKPAQRTKALATLMNQHMATKSAYTWIRSRIVSALDKPPTTKADSTDLESMEMYLDRFREVRRVYDAGLDRQLLVK
jgi:Tfp pilus assembly protein PilV